MHIMLAPQILVKALEALECFVTITAFAEFDEIKVIILAIGKGFPVFAEQLPHRSEHVLLIAKWGSLLFRRSMGLV